MLNVLGVDPKRITCETGEGGVRRVFLDDCLIAWLDDHGPMLDGNWASDGFRRDGQAVMVAAFDAWKASGGKRLWPEPLPEPVDSRRYAVRMADPCIDHAEGPQPLRDSHTTGGK